MYVSKEQIAAAREMDLLTYLRRYEPMELVSLGREVYTTRSHDSLKISNGKWYWWSRGFGGTNALDYLIKVCDMEFPEAVLRINSINGSVENHFVTKSKNTAEKKKQTNMVELPEKHVDNRRVFSYLKSRGIDAEIINHCIKQQQLYEDAKYHNCVFVGFEGEKARYAALRGTLSDSVFVGEAAGSDKRFSFAVPRQAGPTSCLYVFESAIDALSFLTLEKLDNRSWREVNTLSLAGVQKRKKDGELKVPDALKQYLNDNTVIREIILCLDNDEAGRQAAEGIQASISGYTVSIRLPSEGKDYNELLQRKRDIRCSVKMRGAEER